MPSILVQKRLDRALEMQRQKADSTKLPPEGIYGMSGRKERRNPERGKRGKDVISADKQQLGTWVRERARVRVSE